MASTVVSGSIHLSISLSSEKQVSVTKELSMIFAKFSCLSTRISANSTMPRWLNTRRSMPLGKYANNSVARMQRLSVRSQKSRYIAVSSYLLTHQRLHSKGTSTTSVDEDSYSLPKPIRSHRHLDRSGDSSATHSARLSTMKASTVPVPRRNSISSSTSHSWACSSPVHLSRFQNCSPQSRTRTAHHRAIYSTAPKEIWNGAVPSKKRSLQPTDIWRSDRASR